MQGEHTQRNTQYLCKVHLDRSLYGICSHSYPDNEPDNCLDTELGKGNGTQRPDSERSDAERGHVQDSHKDVQSSKSERTVGDYEKADTHSVLACLDDDGDFSGFSDSSSTSLKIQRKSRSKGKRSIAVEDGIHGLMECP